MSKEVDQKWDQSFHIKFLSGKLNRNLHAIYIAVGSGGAKFNDSKKACTSFLFLFLCLCRCGINRSFRHRKQLYFRTGAVQYHS